MIYHNIKNPESNSKQLFKMPSIDRSTIITCKHCGAEYLAGEIYIPGALIGQPKDIVKDALGKIICAEYSDSTKPDKIEHYICDYCDKPFVVEANITYKSMEEEPTKDFSTQYVSLLD